MRCPRARQRYGCHTVERMHKRMRKAADKYLSIRRLWSMLVLAGVLTSLITTYLAPQDPRVAQAIGAPGTPSGVAVSSESPTATPPLTVPLSATPTPTPSSTPHPLKPPTPFVHRTNGYQIGAYY